MTLSTQAVETDHKLDERATKGMEALARHRWHWTLDESNPGRVSIRAYARAVGRSQRTVQAHVNAYASWQGDDVHVVTFDEAVERAKVSAEKAAAIDALKDVSGQTFQSERRRHADDVRTVRTLAEERAERRQTTVAEELPAAAQQVVKSRQAAKRDRDARKASGSLRYIEIEGKLAGAMRYLRDALNVADEVTFSDEERDLLTETLGRVRALLSLVDMRLAGTTDVDWDAELAKIASDLR